MKNDYKINEISKLYGIGVDALRYYEKLGLLQPRRDGNGYRLYSLQDMYKLNIIRDLRQLDFTMQQIKAYLDQQSVENTLELLFTEQELIKEQIAKLETTQRIIQGRIKVLTDASSIQTGVYSIKTYPNRPCLQLNTRITRDEEMDYAIKKLHQKHNSHIPDFGNQLYGASVSLEELKHGVRDVFNSVFFIFSPDDSGKIEYDYFLPAGDYLSLFYRGNYRQSHKKMLEVVAYANDKGLRLMGDPFEIYEIDNRDTIITEQFLTEIQLRIAKE
ncbi:MAG TPA: MerR family DNA-binding transcriptional regulator [Paenibacillus sp.]|uniref:MerR family transcriptional regulator n=1 Tax=Paenibacillus TaxID=44249 RepID=UPI000BA11F4D|nr:MULTISPECIES: MerR family transcriptional regulator [Paenibacillus]OZQ74007.1 MerR family transcriptional regulator [Paenibacillus taichungensis]HBU82890.1 MerR family DNA-binding transcriptional regulator [Paenibacillus sp.]